VNGLNAYLAASVVSDIMTVVERVAIQSLAAVVIPKPVPGTESGPLDPAVVLSIRQVVATASGLAIFPALGAFGSVAELQFPDRVPAPSSGKCALTSMMTLLELSSLKERAGVKRGFGLRFYVVAGFCRA
jgi:hypothetical protein